MTSTATGRSQAFALILGVTLVALGLSIAGVDDKPGAAVPGFVLMVAGAVFVLRARRGGLSTWAARAALAGSAGVAALAAFLIHSATVTAPLFAQSPDVPSVTRPEPSAEWVAAVDRARPLVRAAILDQNLPGVSIAVGVGNTVVWAEGFGLRDITTHTPVTPDTRFNIGTAAPMMASAAAASLGLTGTGTDSATEWSPAHVGEPEEDFPGFTFIHDVILRPIGIADPARPLAGDRATFYVPRSDDNDPRGGRRPMFMRDLACCANGQASYSTPSDLVRIALATNAESVNGDLAGGHVMSLVTRHDRGIVVAVTSNIAYANTTALAQKIADAFATGN